jgi:hypothetical protein
MTDHAAIVQHLLLSRDGITAAEWCKRTGSTKLTTRISEMKRDGAEFFEVWCVTREKKRYKKYWLRSLENYKK